LSIASEVFTSQVFPEEEKTRFSETLKDMIDVITELNGTESDDFDEMLFSAMKLVVIKWKASILSGDFKYCVYPHKVCMHYIILSSLE
jgi:hypothetical protein